MESINNTLLIYIKNELFYKNLIDKFNEIEYNFKKHILSNEKQKQLIEYCKKNSNSKSENRILYKFIYKKCCLIKYQVLFLKLIEILPIDIIINNKSNDYILLWFFTYKKDYDNFKIVNSRCNGCLYLNIYLFLKVINTKNNDFINLMFEKIYSYVDKTNIDTRIYNYFKDIIINLKKDSFYELIYESVNTLTYKIKNSYINYLKDKILNEEFYSSDNEESESESDS